jgi:predicted kinase
MVLIDATNLTKKSRRPWRKLAKEFGLSLDIYLVETPFEVCLERNTGTGAVPEDVLRRMHETYQRPTENEGRIIF